MFTNIQTAHSTSCLLFLCSEILNISTSPHEFKMASHISVAFQKLSACLVRKRLPVRDHYCNLIQSMCVCPVQVCSSKPLIPWNDSPFEWKSNCSAVFLTHTLKPLWQCSLHISDSLLEMPVISEHLTNSDLKSVSQELWRIEHTHTHTWPVRIQSL